VNKKRNETVLRGFFLFFQVFLVFLPIVLRLTREDDDPRELAHYARLLVHGVISSIMSPLRRSIESSASRLHTVLPAVRVCTIYYDFAESPNRLGAG
jgi:hypothetical protein